MAIIEDRKLIKTQVGSWQFLPGSLAVWLGIKYPKLFAAALGRRALLQAKVDFYNENALNDKKIVCKLVNNHTKGTNSMQGHSNLSWIYAHLPHDVFHKRNMTELLSILENIVTDSFLTG